MSKDRDSGRQKPLGSPKSLFIKKRLRQPLRLSEDHFVSLIYVRRARSALFGEGLFSDPAWDILLELHVAHLSKRTISLPELARAIETPLSTTERWVVELQNRGLVSVTTSPSDADRVQVELMQEAASKLEQLGNQWGSAFVSI